MKQTDNKAKKGAFTRAKYTREMNTMYFIPNTVKSKHN